MSEQDSEIEYVTESEVNGFIEGLFRGERFLGGSDQCVPLEALPKGTTLVKESEITSFIKGLFTD